jgi:hypothetical protein
MKSVIFVAAALVTQMASAQRPPVRIEGGHGDRRVVIRVDENERQDRNQNQRILELERAVRDLQYRVYDLEDQANGHRPPVVPAGPECTLLGAGSYNGYSWNFRVAVDGSVLSATDNFDAAINTINTYKSQNICAPKAHNTQCSLMGAGSYNGYSWNFRVALKNLTSGQTTVVAASDNQQAAINTMSKIRQAGICQ